MRRFLSFLLLLAIVWTGGWFYLTGVLRDRYAASLDAMRANGWVVSAGTPVRTGFPLAAAIAVPDVTISGGTALPTGDSVRTSRLVLAFALARPQSLSIDLPAGFEERPPHGPPIEVRGKTLVGAAPLFGPATIEFTATDLSVARAGVASGTAAHARLRLERRGPGVAFRVALDGVGLPPGHWALGPRIASVIAAGDAAGALAVPPVNGVLGTMGWLAAWRDHGGKLTFTQADLTWGPLRVAGSGSAVLDTTMQPDAEAALTVEGYNETIAAMAKEGIMTPASALAAQFAFGLLAKPSAPGTPPRIDVHASLHGGRLTVGGVDLGPVPKLSWPAAP